MNIIISTSSMVPIYEQICGRIRNMIASGELNSGDALPSVRSLAAQLKISALTVKKAYDSLEAEGLCATVHGKGTYVTAENTALLKEQRQMEIEKELETVIIRAKNYGMDKEQLTSLFEMIIEESL
ncbi:MAG: GntR family transcriptional regulator [Erysipelotrichaceae bacterium]|jgi:GntR family transcriptional regulator|nr:GntR family transcriptional regulator [Erysipelotrichaceae bacterium]